MFLLLDVVVFYDHGENYHAPVAIVVVVVIVDDDDDDGDDSNHEVELVGLFFPLFFPPFSTYF